MNSVSLVTLQEVVRIAKGDFCFLKQSLLSKTPIRSCYIVRESTYVMADLIEGKS